MKKRIGFLILLSFFVLGTGWANAGDTYTFTPYDTSDNGDDDIRDLDHYYYYTWGIDLTNGDDSHKVYNGEEEIISASFTFYNIYDSDSDASTLFINLLNDADDIELYSDGVAEVDGRQDTESGINNQFDNLDEFNGINDPGEYKLLTAETSIPKTYRTDITYIFDADDLVALNLYVDDNIFGFGFDPDCHFYNDGFVFTFTTATYSTPGDTSSTPEPAGMILFGMGLLYFASKMRKQILNRG